MTGDGHQKVTRLLTFGGQGSRENKPVAPRGLGRLCSWCFVDASGGNLIWGDWKAGRSQDRPDGGAAPGPTVRVPSDSQGPAEEGGATIGSCVATCQKPFFWASTPLTSLALEPLPDPECPSAVQRALRQDAISPRTQLPVFPRGVLRGAHLLGVLRTKPEPEQEARPTLVPCERLTTCSDLGEGS